jgi:hypothetical protein
VSAMLQSWSHSLALLGMIPHNYDQKLNVLKLRFLKLLFAEYRMFVLKILMVYKYQIAFGLATLFVQVSFLLAIRDHTFFQRVRNFN